MNIKAIHSHVQNASPESLRDMAAGKWDAVMTDALYADGEAETAAEMQEARRIAQDCAANDGPPVGWTGDGLGTQRV